MLLLKNGTFIDWQTLEFIPGDILVEPGIDGKISLIPAGKGIQTKGSDGNANPDNRKLISGDIQSDHEPVQVIDCTGKYITKSFANGHHHAYSALARGMPGPAKSPRNFLEILQSVWWKLDKALDPELIRLSAFVTAMECAKNGVTFVIDHHASPNAVDGSLNIIAAAFNDVGISSLLCYEITDRDGPERARKGLDETDLFLRNHQGLVGLHASFTVGDTTLREAVALASHRGSGIHIHTAEDQADQDHCQNHYHKRVIERLSDHGVTQFQKTILAHCIHLNTQERGLIEGSPSWVVQNADSNLNNGVGSFTSAGLGKRIMLGSDGMHSDMIRSARTTFLSGVNAEAITVQESWRRFRSIHHYLSSNAFKGDGENNLVVLDYDPPTPWNSANFEGHFVYGITGRNVTHVISNGTLIVEDGRLLTVREEELLKEARIGAERLWRKLQGNKG